MAVACGVYSGVFFVLSFFPRGVLNEILNSIESVSKGFLPTFAISEFVYRNNLKYWDR